MEKFYKALIIFLSVLFLGNNTAYSCPNIASSFTITQSHTCGIPRGVTLVNTSTGAESNTSKYYWYFNGVRVDSSVGKITKYHFFNAPGSYSISLVGVSPSDSCRDSTTLSITVTTNKPRIYDDNFVLTHSPTWSNCITQLASNFSYTMQLSVEDTLYNFSIIWGDGSADTSGTKFPPSIYFSHTYANIGAYNIKIISTSGGCTDTINGIVNNERIPSAGIIGPPVGTNGGCTPYAVRFINNSYNTSGSTRFIWDWGDGSTDSLGASTYNDTIFHLYPSGNYQGNCVKTVTLTVKNKCGQSIATWSSVYLYDKDKAKITVDDTIKCLPKEGSTFTFTNASELNCFPGTRLYLWDFGDGDTVGWIQQKSSQTHTYTKPGKYKVTLIDSNGCHADTFSLDVYVTLEPIAGIIFSDSIGCKPLTVTFTDTVTTNLLLRKRKWDFADASNGQSRYDTAATVTHTFNDAGIFYVICTITNPCDTIADTARIEIFEKPEAKINNFGNGCEPYTVSGFNQSSKVSKYAHYFWDFGDSTFSTDSNPPAKTYSAGTYKIKLRIIDTCGTDTDEVQIVVYTPLRAAYWSDTICLGDSTHFNADSTIFKMGLLNDSILSYTYRDSATNALLGSSTNKRFAHRFFFAGQKKITLTVFTQGGCSYSITNDVLVRERPTISFNYSPFPDICYGSTVSFVGNVATVASTVTGYLWNFGDGDFAISKDTVHKYAMPGTYFVTFTVFNSSGCPATFSDSIRIRNNPIARLKVNPNCFGQLAVLQDSSYVSAGNVITQWAYDFTADGVYDAFTKNATYTYGAAGSYRAILRVTTSSGCVGYDTASFVVDTLPNPSLHADTATKCVNQPFVFTNTSNRAESYVWKWGDGSSNSMVVGNATQQHAYTTSGVFSVVLIAYTANGCSDSATINVVVNPDPIASFSVNDTAVCAPFNFHFVNTSTDANSYQWFINGVLISTLNTLPDTLIQTENTILQIKLVAGNTNLCLQDTLVKTIFTFSDPIANFTAWSMDSCNPFTVQFRNTSTNAISYQWYFNDTSAIDTNQNPLHIFYNNSTKDSVYNVRLIAFNANGCDDTIIQPVHVRPRPTANFSMSNTDSCGPFIVKFINLSTPGDTESIHTMHFQWEFGNGVFSTSKDTAVKFNAALNYDTVYRIKLYAFTKHNCVDTLSKVVVVHPNAKANFGMTTSDSCGPLKVQFTNSSTPGNSGGISVMNFRWNFGNGITSSARDTAVTFIASPTNDTIYNVRLVAFSNFGCPDTMWKQVTVYAKPKAQFSTLDTAQCGPATVTFNNTSFPHDTGTINDMSFFWDFGNGLTSTLRNPSTTFLAARRNDTVYNITLIAYSAHGCADTAKGRYRVFPNPIDSFISNSAGCSPFVVNFTNKTYNGSKYYWAFGDGGTDTVANPTHIFNGIYLSDTTFEVKMVSSSIHGCLGDTFIKFITVRSKPISDFGANNLTGCSPSNIQFLNNSQGAISSIWNFGDGTSSSLINPSHIFTNTTSKDTIYNVRLVVTTSYGCKDTITQPIKIFGRPAANFSISRADSCGPFRVSFSNASIDGNGLPISSMTFKWDFGNGLSSILKDNIVTFAEALQNDTTYTIRLIAANSNGCVDTIKKSIAVHPKAKANFTMNRADSCGPFRVSFINTSINGNGLSRNVMSFKWDFGNGIVSSAMDTSVQFIASLTKDTVYNIKLIAFSNFGCVDTIIKQVTVFPKPKSRFVLSDTSFCGSGAVTLTNTSFPNDTGSINIMTFLWDFGNGKTSMNRNEQVTLEASRLQDTVYKIMLYAYSEHGCVDSSSQNVILHPKPIDSFTVIPSNGCYNFPVQFSNRTINGKTYFWDFGDGTTDTAKNVTHYYTNTGYTSVYYYPKLISVSANGCFGDTVSKTIEVKPKPFADFDMAPDSGCRPLKVQFLNMSIGATNYLWNFGDGTTSNQINPQHYFYQDTVFTITLTSYSQSGCPDTVRKTVRVKAFPNGVINTNISVGCTPLQVNFTNFTTGAIRYEWFFGDGFSDTTSNPSHQFVNSLGINAVYKVMMLAYNSFGCADTTFHTITVYPRPIANFNFAQPALCGNSRFHFANLSNNGNAYLWKFSDGGVDTAANPIHDFIPAQYKDTTYTVTLYVTSLYGCRDTITKTVIVRVRVKAKFKASPTSGCVPLTVNFTDSSKNAASLIWYFGDGTASSIRNPVHTYTTVGKFTVFQLAVGDNGCIDTIKFVDMVQAIEVPKAGFVATPILQSLPASKVQFRNTSIFSVPVTYLWKFGDGTTSVLRDPTIIYSDTGNFKVVLIVTNGYCTDSAVEFIKVLPYKPIASFKINANNGCMPLAIAFNNKSTDAINYYWEFGDGNTSTLIHPIHTYQNPGKYTVRLRASGLSGVDDTIMNQIIEVYENPIANFVGGPLVNYLPKGEVSFTNLSLGAVKYLWRFTNTVTQTTITDTARNPTITFLKEGLYTVSLTAYSIHGCIDSIRYIEYIKVVADGQIYIPNAFTPDGDLINDIFKPEGYGVLTKTYRLRIYNRWGELLFESNDPEIGWDGSYKYIPCAMDTYVWMLEGKFVNEKIFRKKGTFMLLR